MKQYFYFRTKITFISYFYIQWFQNLKFNFSVHNFTPEQQDSLDVQLKQGLTDFHWKKFFKLLLSLLFYFIQSLIGNPESLIYLKSIPFSFLFLFFFWYKEFYTQFQKLSSLYLQLNMFFGEKYLFKWYNNANKIRRTRAQENLHSIT